MRSRNWLLLVCCAVLPMTWVLWVQFVPEPRVVEVVNGIEVNASDEVIFERRGNPFSPDGADRLLWLGHERLESARERRVLEGLETGVD